MTPALRVWHRRIWYTWTLLLPLGFIIAVYCIPRQVTTNAKAGEVVAALPVVVKSSENDLALVNLRDTTQAATGAQLEIKLKRPLAIPSTLVYVSSLSNGAPQGGQLLGQLGSKEVYRFDLSTINPVDVSYVILYDPVGKRIFQTIKL